MLFNETWFSKGMEINIDGYKSFHCSRPKYNKRVKSNRGGISVYCKHHISTGISIVKSYEQGIIWIKLDKIFFKNEKDYFLCLAYIPPENSSVHKNSDFDFFTVIENDVCTFSTKGFVFVCGDLNSRTDEKDDHVKPSSLDKFVHTLPGEYENEILENRISQDKTTNSFGNRLLQICKETGLRIMNGRHDKDRAIGKFTCYNNNGSSVVDYLLTKYENFDKLIEFYVGDANEYSKHVPIVFSIATKCIINEQCIKAPKRILKWRDESKADFIRCISENIAEMENIVNKLEFNDCDINNVVNDFTNILHSCSFQVFGKVIHDKGVHIVRSPWFNDTCRKCKNDFKTSTSLFKQFPTIRNRDNMLEAKRIYNRNVKKAKRMHYIKEKNKVTQMAKHSPK